MLEPYRGAFNARFSHAAYRRLLIGLEQQVGQKIDFRVCETPCFLPKLLLDDMATAGREMTLALVNNAEYRHKSEGTIPDRYRVPHENTQPNFMTVDFGFILNPDGSIGYKLVELQAFPSVYGYQDLLSQQYVKTYNLSPDLRWHLGGHDRQSYWKLLRKVIVADHDPETVVLLEVTPERQKTRSDFDVYRKELGIAVVDIAKVRKVKSQLLYISEGRSIPISRIFNRAIVDEIEREGIVPGFDHRDDLQVEWAGHPNWYFRASKFSLPYLKHSSVPKAVFLSSWFDQDAHSLSSLDLGRMVLKPLYSFAGKGIRFAPTPEELSAIPEVDRNRYLLQDRVHFEPLIKTPHGLTQAEVRIMYLWPDGGELEPVISLVRLGRGLMMGVDQNREQEWVGGSAALFPGS